MDIKRITSGLLGFPLVLIILLIGNKYVVDVALSIIAILAMSEYFNAVSKVCNPVRWGRILKLFKYICYTSCSNRIFKCSCDIRDTNNINYIICTSHSNRNENKF